MKRREHGSFSAWLCDRRRAWGRGRDHVRAALGPGAAPEHRRHAAGGHASRPPGQRRRGARAVVGFSCPPGKEGRSIAVVGSRLPIADASGYRHGLRTRMNAEIIATGSELVLGETVDTNSAYLARQLAAI